MALCEKIVIAGFSGAGKSRFLKEVEATAPEGWENFVDLDQVVFRNHGKGFKDLGSLIEAVGWEKFRLWERQDFEGWLKEEGKSVMALGGGALSPVLWDSYKNSRKIRFCYLKAEFEVCWERLTKVGAEARPLVKKGKEELRRVFEERVKVFSQIGWQVSNGNGVDLQESAMEFWEKRPR